MAEECFQTIDADLLTSKNILCSSEMKNMQLNELEFQKSSIQSCSPTDSADTEDSPVKIISISSLNELKSEFIGIVSEYHPETESIQVRDSKETNTVELEHEPVEIFLETPIIDENNVCLAGQDYQKVSVKPKRISDDFFSSDDGDDEKNISYELKQKQEEDELLSSEKLVNNANILESKLSAADECLEEEDTNSSSSNINKEYCIHRPNVSMGSAINPAHMPASSNGGCTGQGTSSDLFAYYDNDVQSMDAIERRDFVEEQKLTGGGVIKNSSLVNEENCLDLEYLESYRQEIKKVSSENKNATTNQKELSTTPTSSRCNTVRLTKSAAKLNLSATLDELCVKYPIKEKDNSGTSSKAPTKLMNMQNDKQRDIFLTANSDDSLSSDKSYNTSSNHSLPIFFSKSNKIDSAYNLSELVENNHLIEKRHLKEGNESVLNDNIGESMSNAYSNPVPSTSSHNSKSQFSSYCCEDIARPEKRDTLNTYEKYTTTSQAPAADKAKLTSTIVSSKSKRICNFTTDGPNSLSSGSSRSSRTENANFEDHMLENSGISLPTEQTENDFDDDTWADCEDGSDEEVCTCFNYLRDSPSNCLEDELPSRDVDLSGYIQSVTISEDIFLQDSTSDIPAMHRKRKLRDGRINENNYCGTPFIRRKRIALDCAVSPITSIIQSIPSGCIDRRTTPRLLIPTKDNPPPELQNWITQFQRWSHVERLVAVDRLIEHCEPTQVRHMMKVIEPQFQRDFISLLPKELALQVLSYLDPNDLLRAAQTCRSWRFLCDDNLLWKEKCKQAQIVTEPNSDRPKRGRAGNMPPISSPWKAAYMRQHIIEMNWRSRPIREPKVLKGHDDHVITCLQFYGNRIVSGSDDNTLKVWSAVNGKCLRTLVGHTGGVWSSQMSGNIIISGSTDRTLKVWDMETGQCIHTLQGHTSTVRCMHLHGNKVVSGSRDATLRVWDIEQGSCLHVLVGHLAAVRCVQYDGKLIVSGAYDYMVKVWNPERQECLHTLQGHTNRVYSLQFDGIHVVSGSLDTSIRVWDAETGSCKHTLMGHQSLTSGMELRQNILVSGNADSTVKVWDITTGQCLQTLSGPNKHQSAVTCLQFNSRFVITSSDDGTVKLWDVNTGEFIRNLVALDSGGSGGVVWRIRASDTKLICAVGSRNGTEETKLMVLDFDVDGACVKCS